MKLPDYYNLICWVWIAVAIIIFPVLVNVTQPYGRHTNRFRGPAISNRLGWFIMELPALVIVGYFILAKADLSNRLVLIPALLWGLHYTHRALIFPLRIRTTRKKILVLIVALAFFFNLINGTLNGYSLAYLTPEFKPHLLSDLRLFAGTAIFLTGFVINKYHDYLLIKLRSTSGDGYKIPHGALFKYVSCPNFLGEIISWAGFALAAYNLAALSFLIWTAVNLVSRALDHHKWYIAEFPEYDRERKAIIPFIL